MYSSFFARLHPTTHDLAHLLPAGQLLQQPRHVSIKVLRQKLVGLVKHSSLQLAQ
jgi:hypothetical protein